MRQRTRSIRASLGGALLVAAGALGAGSSLARAAHAPTPRAGEPALRGLEASDLPPLREAVARLDAALVSGGAAALSELLVAEPTAAREAFRRMREMIGSKWIVVDRRSEILAAERIGATDAVYVRSMERRRPRETERRASAFDERLDEGSVLFFRRTSTGPRLGRVERFEPRAARVLAAVEVGCPPCAWSFPRPEGWFLVPRTAAEGGSFDAISCVHPDLEVSIDFDAQAMPEPWAPADASVGDELSLADSLGVPRSALLHVSESQREEPGPLPGTSVRRAERIADYPLGATQASAIRYFRIYRSVGPFLFTHVTHGLAGAVAGLEPQARAIADSLRIRERAFGGAEHVARVAAAHERGSGVEAGDAFACGQLGIAFDPPAGWRATRQPGLGRFCVRYESESDPGATLTVLTREGDAAAYGESAIEAFFAARIASLAPPMQSSWKETGRVRFDHGNGVDVAFQVDSRWTEGSSARRERFVAVPLGKVLLCFVARAPEGTFDQQAPVFDAVVASLRRAP